jgi:hypothetical protein
VHGVRFGHAGKTGFLVDPHAAAPALAKGLTAGLCRGDPEVVAKQIEQRSIGVNLDCDALTVELERNHLRSPPRVQNRPTFP